MDKIPKFRIWRIFSGLSQNELAEIVGCSQAQISLLERAFASPSEEMRAKIARVLGQPESILFSNEPEDKD